MNDYADSEKRYRDLKKEKSKVNYGDPVKKRFKELKEKAKQDFIRKHQEREREREKEERTDSGKFITY